MIRPKTYITSGRYSLKRLSSWMFVYVGIIGLLIQVVLRFILAYVLDNPGCSDLTIFCKRFMTLFIINCRIL